MGGNNIIFGREYYNIQTIYNQFSSRKIKKRRDDLVYIIRLWADNISIWAVKKE